MAAETVDFTLSQSRGGSVTTPFGAIQIANDYARETADNNARTQQLLQVATTTATEAAFQRDRDMSEACRKAIAIPDFDQSAQLTDDFGEVLATISKRVEAVR